MKKTILLLVALGVVQLVGLLYFQTKQLKQPIVIASEVDFATNYLYVPYISNRLSMVEMASVEVGGVHYYPESQRLPTVNDQVVIESYANYTYYALLLPRISLHSEQRARLMQQLETTNEATVYFKDGSLEHVTLHIQEKAHNAQLEFVMNSAGSDGVEAVWKLTESLTLHSVEMVDEKVEMRLFSMNGKKMELPLQQPLELKQHDQIRVETTDGLARFPGDLFMIRFHVTDQQGKSIILTESHHLNSAPDEQWVEQMIEERGKR